MSAARGRCPVCRYQARLRKDGTMQRHSFGGWRDCGGSGEPALPWNPDECDECIRYRLTTPGLVAACHSVGIERGRDGAALLREVLEAYHGSGHAEALPPGCRHAALRCGRGRAAGCLPVQPVPGASG